MSSELALSRNKQLLIVCVLLIFATLAAFWQVKNHEFVSFDDNVYVTENINVQKGISFEGFQWAFRTTQAEFWHPLTWLSLMADHQLYGLNAGGYHMTNLILHILSTLLLFWLFNRMTKSIWRSAFVAALFALHPLHVESVAWIAERKDVLSAFFWMLTLCLYVYYTEKPVLSRYLPVLLCFALGLMSKSMLVTLPIIMILLDYWPMGRLWHQNIEAIPAKNGQIRVEQRPTNRKVSQRAEQKKVISPEIEKQSSVGSERWIPLWQFKEKIPFFILSIVFGIVTLYAQKKMSIEAMPSSSRITNALVSYMTYLEKTFYPHDLAVFYPFIEQISGWKVFIASVLIVLISIVVIMAIKRFPYLFVGWLWFVLTLIPVIGVIRVGNHAWADRYAYLPSIGISIILAWGGPLLLKKAAFRRIILLPTGITVVAILAVLTWLQCGYWKNSITLYEHALQVTENNDLANYNLANAFVKQGNRIEAAVHYREAIRINPRHEDAHVNFGVSLADEGKFKEAVARYQEAIKINPNNESAYSNQGISLAAMGKNEDAAASYVTAIKLNPNYDAPHYNLANLLVKQGDIGEACDHYRRAIEINSDNQEAHSNLADILVQQGKIDEAIEHYRQVLRINPASFRALNNLGVNLERQLQHDEAVYYYRQALKIEPSNPGVHFNMGIALGNKGDLIAAIEHFRTAVSLNPNYDAARSALKLAQEMQRKNR